MSKTKAQPLSAINDAAQRSFSEFSEALVTRALERAHPLLVKTLYDRLLEISGSISQGNEKAEEVMIWEAIVSLSSLRRIVGGRFHLLRDRWVAAGFPLKEHRGVILDAETEQGPEVEKFFSWLASQGFQVRTDPEKRKTGTLFEIRKVV